MSSVRERLRAAEKPEEVSVSTRPRTTLVVGNAPTSSTRDRADRAASDAAGDPVVRNKATQARGLTESAHYNQSLRSRLEREEFVRRHQANPEPESRQELSARVNAAMEENIRLHNAALARERAEEAAAIASGRLIRL